MEKLILYLRRNRIRQRDFAKMGGWADNTVSAWCTGQRLPNAKSARRIAELTGGEVPISTWFGQENTREERSCPTS